MRVRFRNHWLLAVIVATGRLAPPAAADEAWKPHLEESNGEAKELGDPKELKDKDWLGIRYGEYSGYKTRLGVVFSEVEAAYPPKYKHEFAKMIMALSGKSESVAQPQNHLEELVRQALTSTNRFDLVERTTATANLAGE